MRDTSSWVDIDNEELKSKVFQGPSQIATDSTPTWNRLREVMVWF